MAKDKTTKPEKVDNTNNSEENKEYTAEDIHVLGGREAVRHSYKSLLLLQFLFFPCHPKFLSCIAIMAHLKHCLLFFSLAFLSTSLR